MHEMAARQGVVGNLHDVVENGDWQGLDMVQQGILLAPRGPGPLEAKILLAKGS
jgi:hypothetical protein